MSEIRVLIFTHKFIDDKLPGLQSKLFDEYQNLSKKIKLVIVSGNIKKNHYNNIKLVDAPSLKFPIFQNFFTTLSFFLAAIKTRNNYEIIFSRMLNPVHLFPAIVIKLFLKKKLIVWISGTSNLRKGPIEKKIVKIGLNHADYIGCSSEFEIKDIEFYGLKIDKNKVFYINPGINLSKFKPDRKINYKQNILIVTRITPLKGIEDSIKIIPFLKEKFPDLKLRIVGIVVDKDHFQNLKNLVSELECENFVEFVGPVPNNKLHSMYNSSDLFLFTSKHEGQPSVILEAMACGLPVISTTVGAVPDIIEDGINGYLIKEKNPKIIADKISLLLANEQLRNNIGMAARETMEKKYSLEIFTDNLINQFKKARNC